MQADKSWNAKLYDDKHSFVFKHGEGLLSLLNAKSGERILDVGSGTGHLTAQIAATGALVIGLDRSETMVVQAKSSYQGLDFRVGDVTKMDYDRTFDAVFSNATLHWVTDKVQALNNIYRSLKKDGRLVLEMGGKGNIQSIVTAIKHTLIEEGLNENAQNEFWYFPSIGEYTTLLEAAGFRVNYAVHFDRNTELADPDDGMADWIRMFAGNFFTGIKTQATIDKVIYRSVEKLKSQAFRDGKWYADYVRLRIVATKE